ncbi:MAG: TonB-dependent receptor [Gemmatimonadota bacterium]|nr:TonB-dependent receptor [Gemmatimonadota bacterium]
MTRSVARAILTLAVASSFASAQSTTAGTELPATTRGEIRGRVVNAASKTPIGIATVDVIGSAATSVGRASTSADGSFRVDGVRAGRYRVRVRALGYAPRELSPVVIDSAAPSADVGTVALTATAHELESLLVTGQRAEVQLSPDRNTYVVRDMPTSKGGSALDVLRNVPAVDVDIDNVVSLRGSSGVVVQINGRKSPLKPAQLGNFLAQLSADMVDKVEVVPNPSARDDPEGVAGIINIVLKQEADAGTSGGLTLTGGTTGRAEVGGNMGYQRGALSLYGSYGFSRDSRPRNDSIYRENDYFSPRTYLEETGYRTQIPLIHTVTGSASYKPAKHDELSADLLYSTRVEHEANSILYRDLDAARDLTGFSDRLTRDENYEGSFESTLGYKHAFAAKGHRLSSELRTFRGWEGGPSNVAAHALALDGSPAAITALETATGWTRPHESSLKLDYSRPLSNALRLSTGYKGSLQRFHTTLDTQVFDSTRAAYLPDTTRVNDFTYDQLVHAAYGMLDAQLGNFQLQGGVRVEHAATQFHLNTSNAAYDNRYNSVFPSALVAYNVDDSHQVKLSYSTRIRRPDDADLLDPTLHYQDPLNVSRGNPNLRPEYIRALELGLQRTADRMTLQVTSFFRHTIDAVRTLRTIDSAGVATRTFANVATSDAYGTDVTVALSGGALSGFAGASVFEQVSNASNLDPSLSARTLGWTARMNASYRATSTFDLQSLLFYQAPMTVEQGRNASRTRFSFAARRKLMADQLSVTLRVIDPFNMSRETNTTIDPRFFQVTRRSRAIRGLLLSVNWTFGRSQKEEHRGQPDLIGWDPAP